MIYRYKPYTENSPNGTSIRIRGNQDNQPVELGEIEGWHYAYLAAPVEQRAEIQAEQVTLTDAQKEQLTQQRHSRIRKLAARDGIEQSVGDIYDLVADAMKLIEFNMMLTARLAGDIYGTNPISDAQKQVYMHRNKAFLDAVDAGHITLRGDFEDMDKTMQKMFKRVSMINNIVNDSYISRLKEVGLK